MPAFFSRFVVPLILVLAASSPSRAADLPLPASSPPVFLVIFDLRAIEPGEITNTTEGGGPVAFPISAIDDKAVACSAVADAAPLRQLKGYVECAIGHRLVGADFNDQDRPTIADRQKAAKAVAANLFELRKSNSTRAISNRGSDIVVVGLQFAELRTIDRIVTERCLDSQAKPDLVTRTTYEIVLGRKPQFTIAEVTRQSQIETDFRSLLTLGLRLAAPPPPPPPQPAAVACQQRAKPTVTYASESATTNWSSGHAIPLADKRATVTLDATLPAVAPQLLDATPDSKSASEAMKEAAEFFRLDGLREQETEDLKLFDACPATNPGRLDSLQQIVCALDRTTAGTSSMSLAAVEALSKLATAQRATFLRWVVEHKTGDAREKALVALAQVAPPAPAQGATTGKEIKQTAKFLSGPLEHWSISADVFTTRQTPFKTDDSGAVVIDGTPPVFYVSLNFLVGDVPSTQRTWVQNIEFKWLLQGSDSPFDSLGFGIGLRGSYAKRFGIDFDLLSPFVGWTWTTQEDRSQPRVLQTRFGMSLNINKALGWVK